MKTLMFKKQLFYFFAFTFLSIFLSVRAKAASVDCTPDSFGNVTCKDFNSNATLNIDLRIATMHTAANKPIFSSQNHATRKFVRNPNCWASNLDLTCISPSNKSSGNLRAGTLITKRHVILAAHFNLKTNDSIYFVTYDNVTVGRKITGYRVNTDFNTNSPDIEILTLDSDVPETIVPCMFLPSNYANYIANDGDGLPVLYTDQEEKALVADLWDINSAKMYDLQVPITSNRKALNEAVISGDSGDPIFLVLNGKLVIVGCFTWGGAGSGNSLTYYANLPDGGTQPTQNINDLIKASDAVAGVNTGYKISLFDFNATAAVNLPKLMPDQVYMVGKSLVVNLATQEDAEVSVIDLFGSQIAVEQLVNQTIKLNIPTKGIYLVTLRKKDVIQTYKVIVR
ncbi:MAG: T9SS type A sorting domain-containing protein [Bacteroidales bacterium]|nr:T9SS type A sorting domain-containing protein [Bacteroidales bacterium]